MICARVGRVCVHWLGVYLLIEIGGDVLLWLLGGRWRSCYCCRGDGCRQGRFRGWGFVAAVVVVVARG